VELLVVIAIIGILAGLLLPAVQMAREKGRQAECTNNLKNCALAIITYSTAKGNLPPSRLYWKVTDGQTPSPRSTVFNWVYSVLPQLEQEGLQDIMRSLDSDSDPTTATWPPEPTELSILTCPSQNEYRDLDFPLAYVVNGGRSNYQPYDFANGTGANSDVTENGVFVDLASPSNKGKQSLDMITKYDGTTNTIMLTENRDAGPWRAAFREVDSQILWFPYGEAQATPPSPPTPSATFILVNMYTCTDGSTEPASDSVRRARPSSEHPGGFYISLCDGSTRYVAQEIEYGLYARLMTSRGARTRPPDGSSNCPNRTKPAPCPLWQDTILESY